MNICTVHKFRRTPNKSYRCTKCNKTITFCDACIKYTKSEHLRLCEQCFLKEIYDDDTILG